MISRKKDAASFFALWFHVKLFNGIRFHNNMLFFLLAYLISRETNKSIFRYFEFTKNSFVYSLYSNQLFIYNFFCRYLRWHRRTFRCWWRPPKGRRRGPRRRRRRSPDVSHEFDLFFRTLRFLKKSCLHSGTQCGNLRILREINFGESRYFAIFWESEYG